MFLVGLGQVKASLSPIEKRFERLVKRAQVELVLLHSPSTRMPHGTAQWLDARSWCSRHFHLRFDSHTESTVLTDNVEAGLQRLTRRILGTSVGLVLGGGGAKGFAHLGVIKVMQNKGIPIDYIGGVRVVLFFIRPLLVLLSGLFGN